jgi:hypothetical protein
VSAPLPRAVTFLDLFEGLGTLDLAYRAEAAALDDRDVAMTGFVVAAHERVDRYVLVETPGACPDCSPIPVAAVTLEWRDAPPDLGKRATPALVEGRLGVGFAIDADGHASFLRLRDARVTPLPTPTPAS